MLCRLRSGATWQPFEISKDEYDGLVEDIKNTDLTEIGSFARYAWIKFEFDDSFDHITNWEDWMSASCEKHRDEWHKKLKRKGIAE